MKKRYILTFPPEVIEEPITYRLIKDFDIKINILNADISAGEEGHLLLGIWGKTSNINKAVNYLQNSGIKCEAIEKKVRFNQQACIHCGSCTAVCFSGALTMDKENWKLNFNPEKCTVCELCITACPLGLHEIDFW